MDNGAYNKQVCKKVKEKFQIFIPVVDDLLFTTGYCHDDTQRLVNLSFTYIKYDMIKCSPSYTNILK